MRLNEHGVGGHGIGVLHGHGNAQRSGRDLREELARRRRDQHVLRDPALRAIDIELKGRAVVLIDGPGGEFHGHRALIDHESARGRSYHMSSKRQPQKKE
jgi:hypothetical protein